MKSLLLSIALTPLMDSGPSLHEVDHLMWRVNAQEKVQVAIENFRDNSGNINDFAQVLRKLERETAMSSIFISSP